MQWPRMAGAVAVIPAEGEGTGHGPARAIPDPSAPALSLTAGRHSTLLSPASIHLGAGRKEQGKVSQLGSMIFKVFFILNNSIIL